MRLQLLCCAFFITFNSFSQKQASIWYFGAYAGLDFTAGYPAVLTNSALITEEGSATIADREGNLLFYTDGVTVYNRLHQVMLNGLNLWGNYSTTQTLIVPQPGNDSIFYIFTASPQYNAVFAMDSVGFHYSVVNLKHDNGYGDVVLKNILLYKQTTEKITAVHHRNGQDIWVVMHEWGSNCFRSYLVTSNGIDLHPVISCIGSVHLGGGPSNNLNYNYNAAGQMKISPDGQLLALATSSARKVEVFSFDNNTGRVIDLIESIAEHSDKSIGAYYGIEFSSDNTQLYFTYGYWGTGCGVNIEDDPSEVWQYSIHTKKKERLAPL
jgi:hypothetical protein